MNPVLAGGGGADPNVSRYPGPNRSVPDHSPASPTVLLENKKVS